MALHRLLHLEPQLGGRHGAVGEAEVVQVVDGGLSGVGGQRGELLSWKNQISRIQDQLAKLSSLPL